ncbi:hypothetical protein OQA88_6771 [Cercophora sp. LCS_1]
MDSYDFSQPTQPTQTVVDPRRYGEQNSGFSDEDISDIICLLVPYSEYAREELKRIAEENSHHMVGRDQTDDIELDYDEEDDAENFDLAPQDVGEHHIALRFSSKVKQPALGFTFGRNPQWCDVCFENDPHRRLSNIHFRIYLNEHAVLMLEDHSTNGTVVDEILLKSKENGDKPSKRTLTSGSKIKILMKNQRNDLVFLVRVPRRDGNYYAAYQRNLEVYMHEQERLAPEANKTIVPGPGGHVDIFKTPTPKKPTARAVIRKVPAAQTTSVNRLPRSWKGSNNYNLVGEIGKGAFATVYKVTSKFDGLPYAAKELDKTKFMRNGVLDQKVENEMRIMQRVKHPNIVQFVEHLDWDDRLMIIIMEYVGGGDLGKMINQFGRLPEMETRIIAKQLLDAIGYLHNMNITHRDVKPDNILVSSREPFIVKLTDFGLSKMIDNEQTFLRTFCGTLLYCAPEVYSEYAEYDEYGRRNPRNRRNRAAPGQRYDHAVDVWSLGGVLFHALTKQPPFPAQSGATYSELLHQIMTKPLDVTPLINCGVSHLGIDFLSMMLDRRPESRANVETLLKHPWITDTGLDQSFDEVSDEELRIKSSQLSLQDTDREKTVELEDLIPQSDDEIIDDSQQNDENRLSGDESEKENYTFGRGARANQVNPPQRLFGEVNISAIGIAGAIPAERLNLPVSVTSSVSTEILGGVTEIRDSFDSSDDSLTPRQPSQPKSQPKSGDLRTSVLIASQSRSVEEINNMTFNVESQSLGGAESFLEHLNVKSRGGSLLRSHTSDLNMSKRKPSLDSGDEIEAPTSKDRRALKRLRSEGSVDLGSEQPVDNSDYELLAQIPPISRAHSGRQIDTPIHKSAFWSAQDKTTWHLQYPEMTQLQFDAFKAAANSRSEEFGPGKTRLWDVAVKYFPPTRHPKTRRAGTPDTTMPPSTESCNSSDEIIPSTQLELVPVTMPTQISSADKRVVGVLKSVPGSAVPDMSVAITESMVSWGRAQDNTRTYPNKMEAKVPKYAFKILLWKEDYDPYRNYRPWSRPPETDADRFYFYIATKASNGIHVNGLHLPSVNCQNPSAACQYWVRLYDGDSIVVWRSGDKKYKSELTFRCNWGGSGMPRPKGSPQVFVDEETAERLDELCARTERKMRNVNEHDLRMEEANHDMEERTANIDSERDRSRAFEVRRLEAVRAMAAKRNSPAPYGPGESSTTGPSTWMSYIPGNRTVPTFRTASPSTIDLLRGIRR